MKSLRWSCGWLVGVVVVLFGSAAEAQQKPSILLYDSKAAAGVYVQVESEIKDLGTVGFDDRAASIFVASGSWQLCSRRNFEGDCKTFGQGLHNLPEGLADKLSSLRPLGVSTGETGETGAVLVFLDPNGGGKSLRTTTNISNLANHAGFVDAISSIAIFRGNWEFCTKPNYKGSCVTLGPGVYNLENMNDAIDSLRRK